MQIRHKTKEAAVESVPKDISITAGGFADNSDSVLVKVAKSLGLRPRPQPVTDGFAVQKQADGRLRWFARYSNAWEDRDKEILTEAAHKEYVEWANSPDGVMPELWLWHTKGTKFGETDWVDFSDGFAHASGLIDDTDAARQVVEFLSQQKDVAMSHGFLCAQYGPYITKYRSYELTVLPRERASVWTTDFNVVDKETQLMAFTPERREFLVKALGEDTVKRLESSTSAAASQLKELGVSYKEAESEAEKQAADEAAAAAAAANTANTEVIKAIGEQVIRLTEQVAALAESQKSIKVEAKKTADDIVSEEFTARLAKAIGGVKRPSEDTSNAITKEAAAEAGAPGATDADFFVQQMAKSFGIVAAPNGQTTGIIQ